MFFFYELIRYPYTKHYLLGLTGKNIALHSVRAAQETSITQFHTDNQSVVKRTAYADGWGKQEHEKMDKNTKNMKIESSCRHKFHLESWKTSVIYRLKG